MVLILFCFGASPSEHIFGCLHWLEKSFPPCSEAADNSWNELVRQNPFLTVKNKTKLNQNKEFWGKKQNKLKNGREKNNRLKYTYLVLLICKCQGPNSVSRQEQLNCFFPPCSWLGTPLCQDKVTVPFSPTALQGPRKGLCSGTSCLLTCCPTGSAVL